MVLEKIKVKKNAGLTITGLVINLLLVIGIFTGMFLYFQSNVENVGGTVDSRYNETYSNLNESRENIDDNVADIRTNLNDIAEADNIAQVAWNGLKGLGNTLKLPISFVSSAVDVWEATGAGLDGVIPAWIFPLVLTALVAITVLLILAALKGEPKL